MTGRSHTRARFSKTAEAVVSKVPVWTGTPAFPTLTPGVSASYVLPVSAQGDLVTVSWGGPTSQPSWVTFSPPSIQPTIYFSGGQSNTVSGVTLVATANSTSISSNAADLNVVVVNPAPSWSSPPSFSNLMEGVSSTQNLPVTVSNGAVITVTWVGPGTIAPTVGATYPWISLQSGTIPTITFTNPPAATVSGVVISALANGQTVSSATVGNGSVNVTAQTTSTLSINYALETTSLIPLPNGAQLWNSAFTTIHGTLLDAFEGSHTVTVCNGLREYNPGSTSITLPNGLTIPSKSQIEVYPNNNQTGNPTDIGAYDNLYYHYIPAIDSFWFSGGQFSRATKTWITGGEKPDWGLDFRDPINYPNGVPNAEDVGNKSFGTTPLCVIRPLNELDTDPSSRQEYLDAFNPHNAWSADLNCGIRIGGSSGGASQNYNVGPIYFIAPSKNFADTAAYPQPYVVWARRDYPATVGGNSPVTFSGRDGACFAGEYVYWVGGSWFNAPSSPQARNWFYRMKVTPHLVNRSASFSGEGRIEALPLAPFAATLTVLKYDPFSETLCYITEYGIAVFDLATFAWTTIPSDKWSQYISNFLPNPRDIPFGNLGDFIDRVGVSTKEVVRKYMWRPGVSDKFLNDAPGDPKDQSTKVAERTRSVHSLEVVRSPQNWATRSTAPGVMWAHDFSESDAEVDIFTNYTDSQNQGRTNPVTGSYPNALRRISGGPDGSYALRTICVGNTLTQAAPLGVKGASHVLHVSNAADWPDPATTYPYSAYIGLPGSGQIPYEEVRVTARNVGAGTLTVTRKVDGNSYPGQVGGVTYAATDAPPYPIGWSIGMNPGATWKRPFVAFAAGQNGKATQDIGLTTHTARGTDYTWPTTRDSQAHYLFRKGYFGSRWYWDTTVNPSAPQATSWTGTSEPWYTTTGTIFEGDEFYLQFRVRIGIGITTEQQTSKFFYLHNTCAGGQSQIFGEMGPSAGELTPISERVTGTTYGSPPLLFTGGGDSRAPAGGRLYSDGLYMNNDSGTQQWQYDYPASYVNPTIGSFCWPADTWVTFLLHVKFGRDNAEAYAPTGISSYDIQPPWRNATDPSFHTTVEWKVHLPGWSDYKVLFKARNLPWFFSDDIGSPGWYKYNPAGINSIWLTPFPNLYQNSGGKPPLTATTPVDFTQVIFSKLPIAPPLDIVAPVTSSYSTTFATDETVLSEGGRWTNGLQTGLLWNNVKTVNGSAYGSAFFGGANNYNDDIAVLNSPTLSANQYAQAVVSRAGGYNPGVSHEIELLLRFSITANNAHGYEVLWAVTGSIAIVRWNGAIGNYTPSSTVDGLNIGAAVDGDVLRAQINGNILSVFKNGAQVASVDVTTTFGGGTVWSSGQPGIGFWPQSGATLTSYGWKSFLAGSL